MVHIAFVAFPMIARKCLDLPMDSFMLIQLAKKVEFCITVSATMPWFKMRVFMTVQSGWHFECFITFSTL